MGRKKKKKKKRHGSPSKASISKPVQLNVADTLRNIRVHLDGGDAREALRLAKLLFAQEADAASEALLVESYAARILQLLSSDLGKEAGALLDIALTKHTNHNASLTTVSYAVWAANGEWKPLLSNYNERSAADRAVIDDAVGRWTKNPQALADCEVLPSDHPLRIASKSVAAALERVTKEVVPNSDLQLREVSRRSPFAPWVLLIRAIAAFYRREDSLAVDLAARVPRHSAPFPIADTLICMIEERHPETGFNAVGLIGKVLVRRTVIVGLMEDIDRAIEKEQQRFALKAIRKLIPEMRRAVPELVKPLMQQLSVRCFFKHFSADEVTRAMGGAAIKDAAFWRLFATAYDLEVRRVCESRRILEGLCVWNEFLYHAEVEGLLTRDAVAAAAVYFKMAKSIAKLPKFRQEDYRELVDNYTDSVQVNTFRVYATNQPDEIGRRLRRDRTGEFVLLPEALFNRATQIYPNTEMFAEWYKWTNETSLDVTEDEAVLDIWHMRCPKDIIPLIHLGTIYLEKGSFKKAEGVLRKGRALDSMNASINQLYRKALSIGARRHIKTAKPHLVEKDIAALTALMTKTDASGMAYLKTLRALSLLSVNNKSEATLQIQEAETLLDDSLAARGLIWLVANQCGIGSKKLNAILPKGSGRKSSNGLYTKSLARIVSICKQMALPVGIPDGWVPRLRSEATGKLSAIARDELTAVAEAALEDAEDELLYAVSNAGLRLGSASYAEFLWYRGHSLPYECFAHSTALFHAAACRARRQGNASLAEKAMKDAVDMLENGPIFAVNESGLAKLKVDILDDKIDNIVSMELEATRYPQSGYQDKLEIEYRRIWRSNDECNCPECRAARGEDVFPWMFDEDEDEDDSPWIDEDEDDSLWIDEDDELDDEDRAMLDDMLLEEIALKIVKMTGLRPNASKRELQRAAEKFIEVFGEPPPGVSRSSIQDILKILAQKDNRMPFMFDGSRSSNRSGNRR